MSIPPQLIILGSSVTALAVARNAADLGMRPIVFDTAQDIATSTRRAEVLIFPGAGPDAVLQQLLKAAARTPTWLIATSDAWVRFIVENRDTLERHFAEILHPKNCSLTVCLDKAAFAKWCAAHDLPAPRLYDPTDLQADQRRLHFPLLLRPRQSNHGSRGAVPKAVEAHDPADLARWMSVFEDAAISPLVSESLLGRRLTQYSVGSARRGDVMLTFVAVKRRPHPELCAVGTYVELSPDNAVEALARRALEALDYQGIAEVEILRDEDSRRDYLIEINTRPWVQFALGPASGHDLMAFLLDPAHFDTRGTVTTGRRWLNLTADLYCCFSRSVGLVRQHKISLRAYVSSIFRANTFAYFSVSDPAPAIRVVRQWVRRLR